MDLTSGRSQAQNQLAALLAETYPFATVTQERHINQLIKLQGYAVEEISEELGHKPHRLFVDIIVSDSESITAWEYHGEQHYHVVKGMTDTPAAVLANQQLDEEKSWILQRLGIPLVAVPYDIYLDSSVLENLLEHAQMELENSYKDYSYCSSCGRRFPLRVMPWGCCQACHHKEMEVLEKENKRTYETEDADSSLDRDRQQQNWKEQQTAAAKQARKERWQQWKNSDAYQEQQAKLKAQRKAAYQKVKEQRKAARQEAKRRKTEAPLEEEE